VPRRFYLPKRTFPQGKIPARRHQLPWARIAIIALGVLVLGSMGWWLFTTSTFRSGSPAVALKPERVPIGSAVPDTQSSASQTSAPAALSNGKGHVLPVAIERPVQIVRVQILNGCGAKGLAQRAASAMRERGFDVRETRNAQEREALTRIVDRGGDVALAERVADSLGVDRSRVSSDPSRRAPDIDVTVILGADYNRLKLNL
jgi:hypothetical protein